MQLTSENRQYSPETQLHCEHPLAIPPILATLSAAASIPPLHQSRRSPAAPSSAASSSHTRLTHPARVAGSPDSKKTQSSVPAQAYALCRAPLRWRHVCICREADGQGHARTHVWCRGALAHASAAENGEGGGGGGGAWGCAYVLKIYGRILRVGRALRWVSVEWVMAFMG
jgi:hypothetical protein